MDKFTVRDCFGSVDVDASVSAYAQALTAWVTANEIPVAKIEQAVDEVFDQHPGTKLPTPFLVNLVVQHLGVDPAQYKAASGRVAEYVKGQCANNTGRLRTSKGKGGGVFRLTKAGETDSEE